MTDARIEASPEDVGMSSAKLRNVTNLVRRYVDTGRYAGVTSLVARNDKVVHFETYGRMDAERGTPVRPDTIYRIYSMTKPVASVGLMALYEEGRFQLNDPVADFIPELAGLRVFVDGDADSYTTREPSRPMTVRDLLMHTSGIGALTAPTPAGELYRRALGGDVTSMTGTLAGMVERLAGLPLHVDPGARWIYSISTDLVGRLCEVISGQPFDTYLRERVFEPLGMVDTGFTVPPSEVDRFAACYRAQDGGYRLLDDPHTSAYTRPVTYFSGAAGLVSTAGDYLRFCRMLTGGGALDGVRVLGSRTVRFMTANHLPDGTDLAAMAHHGGETTREGQGFGLGFGVLLDPTVAQTIGTPGEYFWGGAASTAFFVSPADDLIAIFLTQLRPSAAYPIRRELRAAVYSSITD
jgi:CubicO group peptidase (beta-lactamase class C family)